MAEAGTLRPVTADDLPMVLAWRNHPSIRGFMLTRHEIGLEEHRNWFEKASQDATRRLLIVEEGPDPIGYVQFNNVTDGGVSDWGFYARPDAPKGSGRKLGRAALNHAFGALDLHKVCGQAIDTNRASIALHTALGFAREGVLRDQHYIEGAYHSLVCFGLLRSEWQSA
ncbi:MAG: UDP-4-amino-4,6-dideoxy-N-acetyl-beta-L-altrosamine N-acetyltransferase [Candidimonas sp.]